MTNSCENIFGVYVRCFIPSIHGETKTTFARSNHATIRKLGRTRSRVDPGDPADQANEWSPIGLRPPWGGEEHLARDGLPSSDEADDYAGRQCSQYPYTSNR